MNHHQKPIADYLYSKLGDDYKYVILEPMDEKFLNVGYSNNDNMPYIIPYFKSECQETVHRLVRDSDIMIIGGVSAPMLVDMRLATNKVLLFYSERWHKTLKSYLAQPLRYLNGTTYKRFTRYNKQNAYMLCSGAFVPNDCRWEFAFKNKTYKWGYFPPFQQLDIEKIQDERRNHKIIELLSVCRMLDWKHPEMPLKTIRQLRNEGYKVHLTMVGGVFNNDPKSAKIQQDCLQYIHENHLEDCVDMKGAVKNEEVCLLYEGADIFLFTSDRFEGWGAVLNEAMSRGCASVVSDMIGSAPYLIKDRQNGLLFRSEDTRDLISKVRTLLEDSEYRRNIGLSAYNTIKNTWNPIYAADQLLCLCKALLNGDEYGIIEGPCSRAYPIKNKIL